jgi:hypothetical protein
MGKTRRRRERNVNLERGFISARGKELLGSF